jgi:hypothetical protein
MLILHYDDPDLFFDARDGFDACFYCFDSFISLTFMLYMEKVDNFRQYIKILDMMISRTFNIMDTLEEKLVWK